MCGRAASITTWAFFLAVVAVYVAVLRQQPLLVSSAGEGPAEGPGGGGDPAVSGGLAVGKAAFVRSAGWGTGGLAAGVLAAVVVAVFLFKSALADLHPAVAASGGLFQAGVALLLLSAVGALLLRPSWVATSRGAALSDAHGPFLLELQKPQFSYPLGGEVSLLSIFDGLALSLATALFALAAHNLNAAGAFGDSPEHLQSSQGDGMGAAAHATHLVNLVCCTMLAIIAWRCFVAFLAVSVGSAALCFAGSYALAMSSSAFQ